MNPIDFCLERLFRAARLTAEPPSEPPFGFETRVLAGWRRGISDEGLPWLPLVRGACLCACAIILLTLAFTFPPLDEPQPNELVIVDSAIQLTLMQ